MVSLDKEDIGLVPGYAGWKKLPLILKIWWDAVVTF